MSLNSHLLRTHGGQPWCRHRGRWGHADLPCHLVHVVHTTCVGCHGYTDVHVVIIHAGACLLPKMWWGLLWKHATARNGKVMCQTQNTEATKKQLCFEILQKLIHIVIYTNFKRKPALSSLMSVSYFLKIKGLIAIQKMCIFVCMGNCDVWGYKSVVCVHNRHLHILRAIHCICLIALGVQFLEGK